MHRAAPFVTAVLFYWIAANSLGLSNGTAMAVVAGWTLLIGSLSVIETLWRRRPQPIPLKLPSRQDDYRSASVGNRGRRVN